LRSKTIPINRIITVECRILGRRIQFRVPVEITLAFNEILTLRALKVKAAKRIRYPCSLYR